MIMLLFHKAIVLQNTDSVLLYTDKGKLSWFIVCSFKMSNCRAIIKFGNLEILEDQICLEKGGWLILHGILLQDNGSGCKM